MPFVRRQRKYYKYGTEPNATVVGTPTIVDGVVSGFSTANYLTYTVHLETIGTITSFEKVLKIKTGSDVTTQQCILAGNSYKGLGTVQIINGVIQTYISSNGSSNNIASGVKSSLTIAPNTDYWIKYSWNGTVYSIDVSTDGVDFANYISVSNTSAPAFNGLVGIGVDTGSSNKYPFKGEIDLTKSYFNANTKNLWKGTKVVEVPSSSITDFGSYKYFKNIVTTRYWKEITTEVEGDVLAYAAYYRKPTAGAIVPIYVYAKVPLGEDLTMYRSKTNGSFDNWATGVDDIVEESTFSPWKTVSESVANLFGNTPYDRQYANDIYAKEITTTTTTVEGTPEDYTYTTEEVTPVEVTADDDYDYTEFVPSAEYDYHVDNNKLYQLATVNRSYWKYDYQDFVQPKLTANGTLGGKSFAVEVDSNYDTFYGYKALDGDTSTSWQSMGTTTTGTYFIIYNPLPLNVTKITWSGTPKHGTITGGIVYGSNDNKEYKELATFAGTITGGTMDLSANDKPYKYYKITPTQWTDKTNTHTNGWAELSITAKEQIVVEGTSENYDYYVDYNSSHSFIRIKPVYYKYGTEPNATVVGTPTIVDGVVSGFSTANYLTYTVPLGTIGTITSFEKVLKVKTGSDVTTQQCILAGNSYKGLGTIQIINGVIQTYISSNGSSNNIASGVKSSLTIAPNTDYWIKYSWNGAVYSIDVSTDGVDFANYISVSNTSAPAFNGLVGIGVDTGSNNKYSFKGEIDLTKSYFNTNTKNWWKGTKVVEADESNYDIIVNKHMFY